MKFVLDRSNLSPRETQLMNTLESRYTDSVAREVLLPLLAQNSPISLRALDWCVTNWSKQHNVICSSPVPGELINIHHSYRSMLSFWKRRLFDPFRRRSRVQVEIDEQLYETTLGQANFSLWTYETGVLAYVLGHIKDIETDMNSVSNTQKRARKEAVIRGERKKRKELTSPSRALCIAYNAPCTVNFDK